MDNPEPPQKVTTTFVRSNFSRVIRVDGVWGGITPHYDIHMSLYNERWSLAEGTEIRTDDDGIIRDYPIDVPGVITREVEVDIMLSEKAATFLRDWLTVKLSELAAQRPPPETT